jgi:hypothetical protein
MMLMTSPPLLTIASLLLPLALCLTPEEPTFYSAAATLQHGNFPIHDRPRTRPRKRGDVDPNSSINSPSLNYVNYGKDGHPYEQVQRYYEQRRQLATENGISSENSSDDEIATRRILQEAQSLFQPLRIHFDTTELDLWSMQSTYSAQRVEYLTKRVLPEMAKTWSSALSVVRVMENLRIDYNVCPFADPQTSPSFSEQGVPNADLVIYVTANSEVCSQGSSKTWSSAYSCFYDQFARPIAGTIDFCLDAIDLTNVDQQLSTNSGGGDGDGLDPEADKSLQLVIGYAVHELAHVLGVTSADMIFFYDSTSGLRRTPNPQLREVTCIDGQRKKLYIPDESVLQEKVSKQGVRFFEVTLPTVRQVVRNQFNCQTLTGAALENQPSNEGDCFGSHFDERYFFTEKLSAIQGGIPDILSSLTLGLLHDSGWYWPDYSVAKISVFGHGVGCEFVEENCIVNGEIPSYSEGIFCNTEYKVEGNKFMGAYGCDPTHTGMGICDLVDFSQLSMAYTPPPPEFRYFPDPSLGALTMRTDYCPTYTVNAVTCKEVPGKLDQMKLPILDYFATAAESDSDNSRCFNTDQERPVCLEAECDEVNHVLSVKVAGRELLCSYDGQTHLIPGTSITFECPKLAVVCPE